MKVNKLDQEIYIVERNKLIAIAVNHANVLFGSTYSDIKKKEEWEDSWNRAFHDKMNDLWKNKIEL